MIWEQLVDWLYAREELLLLACACSAISMAVGCCYVDREWRRLRAEGLVSSPRRTTGWNPRMQGQAGTLLKGVTEAYRGAAAEMAKVAAQSGFSIAEVQKASPVFTEVTSSLKLDPEVIPAAVEKAVKEEAVRVKEQAARRHPLHGKVRREDWFFKKPVRRSEYGGVVYPGQVRTLVKEWVVPESPVGVRLMSPILALTLPLFPAMATEPARPKSLGIMTECVVCGKATLTEQPTCLDCFKRRERARRPYGYTQGPKRACVNFPACDTVIPTGPKFPLRCPECIEKVEAAYRAKERHLAGLTSDSGGSGDFLADLEKDPQADIDADEMFGPTYVDH